MTINLDTGSNLPINESISKASTDSTSSSTPISKDISSTPTSESSSSVYVKEFKKIKNSLKTLKRSLTETELSTAQKTLKDFQMIANNWSKVETAKDDSSRMKLINTLAKESGGEAGLENPLSATTLGNYLEIFINTFKTAQEKEKIVDFFQCFNKGDPCLSGRIESLNKFAALQEIGIDFSTAPDPEKNLSLSTTILNELMIELIDDEAFTLDTLTLDGVKEVLLTDTTKLEEFTSSFKEKEDTEYGLSFRSYLEDRELLKKEEGQDSVDWQETLKALVGSKYFVESYNLAFEATKESFT